MSLDCVLYADGKYHNLGRYWYISNRGQFESGKKYRKAEALRQASRLRVPENAADPEDWRFWIDTAKRIIENTERFPIIFYVDCHLPDEYTELSRRWIDENDGVITNPPESNIIFYYNSS